MPPFLAGAASGQNQFLCLELDLELEDRDGGGDERGGLGGLALPALGGLEGPDERGIEYVLLGGE